MGRPVPDGRLCNSSGQMLEKQLQVQETVDEEPEKALPDHNGKETG